MNLMTEGDIRKKIIFFALPILIGNLFQQFYNTADSFIVGNFLGAEALAAVSGVSSLVYLFIGFFTGFSSGAGVVIAHAIGKKDGKSTQEAVHSTIALALVISVLMTVTGTLGSPYILRWTSTPDNVIGLSETYLRIYFLGSFGRVMYNFFTGILEAAGDARHPLYYLVISSLMNIVLDVLFITVFHMGVGGAALATILSEIFSAFLAGWRLFHTSNEVQIHIHQIGFTGKITHQIISYGIPTALQSSVIDLSNILIQSYINSFGAKAMAGIGASGKVEGFAFLPITAFSLAITTFISQNLGAGKYDRVREGMHFCFEVSLTLIELIGIAIFIFAPQSVSLFTNDPDVIRYGAARARVCGLFYLLVGYSHIASGVCRGLGKPAVPMAVMLICWCAVRIIVLFTLGRVWHDVRLCYWIYPFTWMLSTIVFFMYLKKEMKKTEESLPLSA